MTRPIVDFYVGTTFSIREIEKAHKLLGAHISDLGTAHEGKRPVSMKSAADDVHKVSVQIGALASHLASVTTQHVNRKAKVVA